MGRLVDQILGSASGLVGSKLVFRNNVSANIIAKRPKKRTSPPSAAELAFRAKFALAGKVARAINSIAILKGVWPHNSKGLSKFNEIFQANYKLINSVANFGTVNVAPAFGFGTANPVVTADATSVHLVTDPLGVNVGIDTSVEKIVVAVGIVVLLTPIAEGTPATSVIAFKTLQGNLDLINNVDLTANLSGSELTMYESYTDRKVFACLLTVDDSGKAVRFSSTVHS
ncbi:MAG: hypothetical protein P4L35_11555 [Ignavibacteriaceae bacterium]|nr:hypothetical protein [Ignavibacteriaceae bacterium]